MATETIQRDCSVRLNDAALHDLIGPANQIRTMLDLILQRHREELNEDVRTLLDFMGGASDRLQCMMSGLRAYSRAVGSLQPFGCFDANATLEEATAAIQQTIAQNDALVTHDPLPEVWGDAGQIGSVFVSLIGNSIKFRRECRPEVHVSAVASDSDWQFSVRDNGIGIEARQVDRIFGLFQRVYRDSYPGAGIGLAVAKAVIERHSGRIWVESEPGCGATFLFVLPRCARGEILAETVESG